MIVPCLRSPIVLVHGLLGFDQLRMAVWPVFDYFPGIPEMLRAAGNRVLVASLSPTAGVAERAGQLKSFLEREAPGESVHLISHSMGGLDSRYLISRLGMAERVRTLTTIGTPHRGSPFADWGIRRFQRLVTPLLEMFNIQRQAFYDLTTTSCRGFNEQTPDAPGVRYFSVAGRFEPDWLSPEWQLPYHIIKHAEGSNDGLVSVASATYGESCEMWDGDHASLINWPHPVAQARGRWQERTPQYAALVRRLADAGF